MLKDYWIAVVNQNEVLRSPRWECASKRSWRSLQELIPQQKIYRLTRISSSWRKLVTNLVCAVFTEDLLIQSSVTGRNTTNAPLDPIKLNTILGIISHILFHWNACNNPYDLYYIDFVTEAYPEVTQVSITKSGLFSNLMIKSRGIGRHFHNGVQPGHPY